MSNQKIVTETALSALASDIKTAIGTKASASEVEDIRIGANGKTYPSAGDAVRKQLLSIMNYSSYDTISGYLNKTTGTSSGITYTWSGDVCDVNGTSTSYAINILRTSQALPPTMSVGKTYYIKYITTDTNVNLRIIFRDSNSVDIQTIYINKDLTPVTIPNNTAKMTIALYVAPNKVIDHATVSEIAFLTEPTLFSKAFVDKGIIANNTDIDTIKTSGCYVISSSNTYTHSPLGSGEAGSLLVFVGTSNTIIQMVIRKSINSCIFTRFSNSGSFVGVDWYSQTDGGILPNNTDLDTVIQNCVKVLMSSYTFTHSPLASGIAGVLVVFHATDNTVLQMVVSVTPNSEVYERTSLTGSFLQWVKVSGDTYNNTYTGDTYNNTYNISCSPTITTDTNNYLASTGDNTDRTSDIQTMLNTTGYCHLGPGLFVVSGVEIPDYATLEGCGNRTTVRLDPDVASGYTIKLKNQSSVKNLRICGGTSAPTLSATLGTRNGVIFEGTRVSGDDTGTTYKRASITDCIIYYFSGSGILCNKTGTSLDSNLIIANTFVYSCGAGLNIAYYSEFHRIVNSCFTYNWYGVIDNGGNNNFANCDFSGNRIGILIDNTNNQSPNNSHGSFTNCSVNHSKNEAGVSNEGIAIKLLKADRGEIFTGIQIFFGAIILDDCVGTRFVGCNVGRKVPITITDSTVVTFSDCTFQQPPTDADALVTQSGNTVLKFNECYLRTGTVYDPMA